MAERVCPSSYSSRFGELLIPNLVFSDVKLGRGSDATVFQVEWNGTECAAKRLHEVLLEDRSPGGADKLISNFEVECLTWSNLRHPGVVQFLGVYLERSARLPVLIMEKMDTSLRSYLEGHSREEFPLDLKAFVLRQVTQALAYLHKRNPPLVHHDLSPNNVLLNVVSFVTKVTDFGMSRAINPSNLTRKSSIKGTLAFMAPEAIHGPLRYNEKLDIFSFGNIVISTLTHEWPNPGPPTILREDQLVGLNELQRRERYIADFTAQEEQLFLPVVHQCLENLPDKRPSSVMLVRELRRIESSFLANGHAPAPIEQIRQQLSAKEEECRQNNEALRQRDEALRQRDEALRQNNEALRRMNEELRLAMEEKAEMTREKDAALREKEAELQQLRYAMKERDNIAPGMGKQLAAAPKAKHALREWRKLGECQKVIKHSPEGGGYRSVAVNSEGLLAVTDDGSKCVQLLTKEGALVRSIGKGVLGDLLFGVAFDVKGNIWVTDWLSNKVLKLSHEGGTLLTKHYPRLESRPYGVSVSPEGLIFICDPGKHRVTVHGEKCMVLRDFGSKGSGPECFDSPRGITFGSDGLVYVTDVGNGRISVWSNEGTFKRVFEPKYAPSYIAATSDNHLLITSHCSHTVMVYTLEGELVHEFGGEGPHTGRFNEPLGICVDDNGVVYVADSKNNRVQVF